MAFKFIAFAAFVAVANAGITPLSLAPAAHLAYSAPLAVAAPVAKAVVAKTVDEEYDHHPQYSYSYDVHDTLTGDAKAQQEIRDGDVVKGSYSLIEADGTRRVVEYTADPVHGFNAVVHKEPAIHALKTIAAVPVVHATYAAPAPIHGAPVAKFTASIAHAPVHVYAAPAPKLAVAPLAYAAPTAAYIH